ncbi:MAG: glycosyltransferase family 2 protein [Geminicoccaceae bacterium]
MQRTPTVSIGLPVRNGAQHVADAIESILAQTVTDLELIISDNASTDATPSICAGYAARDPRVRYHRHERDLGASRNFNFVFHQAVGQYFKWAAHDDIVLPTFLERCHAALEAAPDAVLCQSLVRIVDERNAGGEVYDHTAFGTEAPRQSDRLAARLRARRCMDIFGLIRKDALRGTALIADHVGADRTLLIELALRGRFVGVPEVLFLNRDHRSRFTRRVLSLRAQAMWYAPDAARGRVLRTWTLYATCLRLVRAYAADPAERRRCYRHMIRSLGQHRRWFRLAMEPIEALEPRAAAFEPWLFGRAAALKRALLCRTRQALRKISAGASRPRRPGLRP